MQMPTLASSRLLLRPFDRGEWNKAVQLLDIQLGEYTPHSLTEDTREQRRQWLDWVSETPRQLAVLCQPPYGDRVIIEQGSGKMVGLAGLVPALAPFTQVYEQSTKPSAWTPEVGLFYAIAPAFRGRGYATEIAKSLVEFGFQQMHLQRIVATTEFSNKASQAVMKKLGMTLLTNPIAEPDWLQVVGVLEQTSKD